MDGANFVADKSCMLQLIRGEDSLRLQNTIGYASGQETARQDARFKDRGRLHRPGFPDAGTDRRLSEKG